MEIKHTVEILTKDIQEIEKLVGNLDNYEIPPQIELDLALSKLRNVYELLMMIRSDAGEEARLSPQKTEPPVEDRSEQTGPVQTREAQAAESQSVKPQIAESQAGGAQTGEAQAGEAQAGEAAPAAPSEPRLRESGAPQTPGPTPGDESGHPREQEIKPKPEHAKEKETRPAGKQEDKPAGEAESDPVPGEEQHGTRVTGKQAAPGKQADTPPPGDQQGKQQKSTAEKKDGEILAERFNKSSSINDEISGKREAPKVEKNLSSRPIDSISRNIGINDRFYIIRELFDGKSEGFNDLIRELDRAPNFEEAHRILEEHFGEEIGHEGVKILVNLSRRKFISGSHV